MDQKQAYSELLSNLQDFTSTLAFTDALDEERLNPRAADIREAINLSAQRADARWPL